MRTITPERAGDNVRRVLRLMSWDDRRTVVVALTNRLSKEERSDPFGRILEAVLFDAYAAEDEERLLADDIDRPGHVG